MQPFSLNISGRLYEYTRPCVMGVINATPDSFHDGSRFLEPQQAAETAASMIEAGASFIDIGAVSTRPGHDDVTVEDELDRLCHVLKAVKEVSGNTPVSVDTFNSRVARVAVEDYGADIINDISGGEYDKGMFSVVASLKVPYIVSSLKSHDIITDLAFKINSLHYAGVADVIADPGFGFGKDLNNNYNILANLDALKVLDCPVLVGLSRKSMLCNPLGISSGQALNATTAANMIALIKGASILRVHDVQAAIETVSIYEMTLKHRGND